MIWVKIIGIVMINICCIYTAWSRAEKYKTRERHLNKAYMAVQQIAGEIRCKNITVYGALAEIANGERFSELCFFKRADDLCQSGVEYPKACVLAIADAKGSFDKGLLSIMSDFLSGLGKSDTEGQLMHCEYYAEKLKTAAEQAKADSNGNYQMIIKLGVLAGVFISVMVL